MTPNDQIGEFCPSSDDDLHCDCWYDGDECCHCGAPAVTDEEWEGSK